MTADCYIWIFQAFSRKKHCCKTTIDTLLACNHMRIDRQSDVSKRTKAWKLQKIWLTIPKESPASHPLDLLFFSR